MANFDVCVDWNVENFSFCPQKCGEFLQSPYFETFSSTSGSELWFLRLYPRGTINNENDISCFFCRHHVVERISELQVDYSIEILSTNGAILLKKDKRFAYRKGGISGFDRLVNRNNIFRQKDVFLPNDILRIRLSMVTNYRSLASDYRFFTVIDVEKKSFRWELIRNISNTKKITFFGKNNFVMTGVLTDNVLKLSTEATNLKGFAGVIQCKLSHLKINNSERMLKESEIFFDGISDIVANSNELTLSPTLMNIASQSRMPDEQQVSRFRCELAFSHFECKEENAEAHQGYTAPPLKSNVMPDQTIDNHDLLRDFLNMYRTKKLTDVTLRVDEQIFQAHKFVLSARSPVFSAMFESEMLENQSGVVDIKDLDANTLKNFLLYLYGGTLQKLNKESAQKLILVADRYLVASLKEICSSYLMSNMSEENVCETLILADMINEENLKEYAIDFFVSHAKVILDSLEWKQFQDKFHPKLANEALRKFAMKACSKSSI